MKFISGEILTENGIKKGYIGFLKGKIEEIGQGLPPKKPVAKGLIIPTLVNSHTHIGDSFIRDKKIQIPKDIEKLVAPPNGLKHRLLKSAKEYEIIQGMEKSIDIMLKNGTNIFCDFRESGILGICMLKTAIDLWPISPIILSRPNKLDYDKNEIDLLLKNSQGIGLSSISDWNKGVIIKISKHVQKRKKIFALHASERIREDIDLILDLKPNLLVHMVKANKSDLERVRDYNIPVVVCPKSNHFFGLKPDLSLMKKVGIDLLLGSDNAMLNPPNILNEIEFTVKNFKSYSREELLYMASYKARKVLNLDCHILGLKSKACFVVIDSKTIKPLYVSIY